jgi:invasion protein IalB
MLLRLFRRRAVWLLALALTAPSAARAQSEAPYIESERFDDWTLVCDNGRRCTAVGLPTQAVRISESGDDALLTIVRDPQTRARARVEIVIPYWEGPGSGGRWALIDTSGKSVVPTLSARYAPSTHVLRLRLPPTSVAVLLSAKTEVALVGASGKSNIALSLIGLKAALTRLDAVQGRSDGVTAIVAKGPRPASAVPAPPLLPVVRKAASPRLPPARLKSPSALVALSARLSELEICAGMAYGVPAKTIGRPDRLDDKTLLWTIWCDPGGRAGLNQNHVPVLSTPDGHALRLLAFKDDPAPATVREIMRSRPGQRDDLAVPMVSNFEFEASTGVLERSDILVSIAQSSESFERYVWTGRQMALFEAVDVSVQAAGESANAAPYFMVWPPYYRAIVLPAKAGRPAARPAAPPR